jgi:hypothetical protein
MAFGLSLIGYQARGRQAGFDLDDWLEAEQEVLSQVPPI